MLKKNKIELLSPAGNLEKMKIALAFGADAVYAGIPDFSLRVRINDFDLEKLKEATEYCHGLNKKIYITLNIFAHNRHIEKVAPYVKFLKKIKVDGLIIADPGVMAEVKKVWPEAEIHLSTQANCTNWRSAKFWFEAGVSRVVLGRETTLDEIKEIKRRVPKLELEYFAHGAMCMAYSGRCFLSKYFNDRSGNLGDCTQPCRWKYNKHSTVNTQYAISTENRFFVSEEKRPEMPLEIVEEEHGSYILNSKDLCLIEYLDKLIEAGVMSLKIEGRAKSVYYQAMVAGIYRRALDSNLNKEKNQKKQVKYLKTELETKLVHRGYTTGFLLEGKADQELAQTHQVCDWEYCGSSFAEVAESKPLGGKRNLLKIKVHNSLKVGDEVEIVSPNYVVKNFCLKKMYDIKTGEPITEAHGGQEKMVLIEVEGVVGEWAVLRRRLIET